MCNQILQAGYYQNYKTLDHKKIKDKHINLSLIKINELICASITKKILINQRSSYWKQRLILLTKLLITVRKASSF